MDTPYLQESKYHINQSPLTNFYKKHLQLGENFQKLEMLGRDQGHDEETMLTYITKKTVQLFPLFAISMVAYTRVRGPGEVIQLVNMRNPQYRRMNLMMGAVSVGGLLYFAMDVHK